MPEIKHTFSAGRMNKDLDERLVPNGEYRDALNVEISGSEGSNVGSVQNILGNQVRSAIGLANAKCVGAIADTENEKIYWFVTNNTKSIIAEFNQIDQETKAVLVDTDNSRLNFSTERLITGINLIDGLLFFTDDENEPKVVDIKRCRDGSNGFTNLTQLKDQNNSLYNINEDDITVLKKGPLCSPTIFASKTARAKPILGAGAGVIEAVVQANFYDSSTSAPKLPGEIVSIVEAKILTARPDFQVGDIVILTRQQDDTTEEFDRDISIRCTVVDPYLNQFQVGSKTMKLEILSIPDDVGTAETDWVVELEQGDALFKDKFIRFASRWKYKNGEYSAFSPFTEAIFVPKAFEYEPKKGYNLGMENELRFVKISDFRTSDVHKQVEEIDILYKDDTNNNVYVVATIHKNDSEWFQDEYTLESEIIYKTVQSNQLLRPYDNVPKKAKAQEISANRLIYGNYVENFNMGEYFKPEFTVENVLRSAAVSTEPEKSLKSMRQYQFGIVYKDELGRETPVFTDTTAKISYNKSDAPNYNQVKIKVNHTAPSGFTHYKYFIKDPSNEYYNLAMDRWYPAEDGNVWISFPSAERNKIQEDSYLILKKKHDTDDYVSDKAKYRVISISNEAPLFIREEITSLGFADCSASWRVASGQANVPVRDGDTLEIFKTQFLDNSNFTEAETLTQSGLRIKLHSDSGSSGWYDIKSFEKSGSGNNTKYEIRIKKKWLSDIDVIFQTDNGNWNSTGPNYGMATGVSFELGRVELKNKPEFQGRFFVKIFRDDVLETNVLNFQPDPEYKIQETAMFQRKSQSWSGSTWRDYHPHIKHWISEEVANQADGTGYYKYKYGNEELWWGNKGGVGRNLSAPDGIKPGNTIITFAYLWKHDENYNTNFRDMAMSIRRKGAQFKMRGFDTVYTVEDSLVVAVSNYSTSSRKRTWGSNKRTVFVLKLDKPITGFDESSFAQGWSDTSTDPDTIQNPYFMDLVVPEYLETFSSQNPAIFETEPKEAIDVDLFYEASCAYPIADHNSFKTLDYFNCYSFGNGVESNRVRDDFNAATIAKGVKASTVLAEQYKEERKKTGLIFSQIYNSTSGVNRTNQFIQAEDITKNLNPEYGSIQKLHTRDTDIITFCEDKVLRVLSNKDALFEADGNAQLTSNARVLGQAVPYVGEYGISKNPESFASFGFRAYFADKARGAIMRLSRDGMTEISMHGMVDYFRDKLSNVGTLLGSYDDNKDLYNITFIDSDKDDTISFKEQVKGWTSRKSFIPEAAVSLNNIYYTFYKGELYSHDNQTRNTFYTSDYRYEPTSTSNFDNTTLTAVLNDFPGLIKSFKTLNYEGTQSRILQETTLSEMSVDLDNYIAKNGWWASVITTNMQSGQVLEFVEKESKWFNYIKGDYTNIGNLDSQEFSVQGIDFVTSQSGDTQATVEITLNENGD